ncbi:hypothetical protein K7432_017324 [Basidiobolus ranarum]|uniref:Uncharacterized protein n=1 Tax=Basidiobolus ranarum TaxID=34480 RepID=A0ABR2WDJ1_9FUNG
MSGNPYKPNTNSSTLPLATIREQRDDLEQQEIRFSASSAIHQYSILSMHSVANGESPARTRLRMMRYISGLPQPTEQDKSNSGRTSRESYSRS